MNISRRITEKPEYFYRPRQILKRLTYPFLKSQPEQVVKLPWGIPIAVNVLEVIGKSIYLFGLYDLSLTEAIRRIVKEGDTVLDVGANIGYTTGLISSCVGKTGQVLAFEPNPKIIQCLRGNIHRCAEALGYSNIRLHEVALSSYKGMMQLYLPPGFESNHGTASLEEISDGVKIEVRVELLDDHCEFQQQIKLLKIDVEGHELSVFNGAKKTLSAGKIRNIIFENSNATDVFAFLQSFGYAIFRINKRFRGVQLTEPSDTRFRISFEADNFLASLDGDEITKLFSLKGWSIYSWK